MDSIKASREYRNFPRERMVVYPPDKEKTDTEIGLDILRERGYKRIILAGGGGGRLDHILSIAQLLERIDGPDIWLTSRERIVVIDSIIEFSG
ncbi:MAG TPA: thiamine diphosphokinase, partial [Spirochaetales bacterium]|nr:thiamine diphosphokinase [Spirochaetales bacterium]